MPRFVAFLRGVMPTNAKMPALKAAFEAAGFERVQTVLGSGNVVFDAALAPDAVLAQRAEAAMAQRLGRTFPTTVRSVAHLQSLLATDPYAAHGIPPEAKRVISFLPEAVGPKVPLPLAAHQACVFGVAGREAYSAYVPTAMGPVFMGLIERAFGNNVTTRTWATVAKCAVA